MKKLQNIQITMQEIWAASRHSVIPSKKKYKRNKKHKNQEQ